MVAQVMFSPKAICWPPDFRAVAVTGYVSGDLYDVMRLDETHIGFYMADAVGHGMPAALLTMFIKNALVTKEIGPGGYRLLAPGETIAKLNEVLLGQNLSNEFFLGRFKRNGEAKTILEVE